MSSGRTASEDFAFVEPEPEPSNATGPLSSAGAGLGKGGGDGVGEREPRPFVLVIVTCVFCFCFPLRFSLSLFSSKVCLQNYRYPGRRRGLGQRSQPFWPFQLPPKLFSRVRQMHPGGRFHFVICVFDILLKCC